MFARLAVAAFVTMTASVPALAANTDGKFTFTVSRHGDAASTMERITFKANEACRFGGHLADRTCVDAFLQEAIGSVKDPGLRAALAGTTDVAVGASASRATRN